MPEELGLEEARRLGLDQLAADGLEERVRDRRDAQGAQAALGVKQWAEHRVAREAAHELPVVVVDGEHEAEVVERSLRRLGVDADREGSVGALPHAGEGEPAAGLVDEREHAVAPDAGRIASHRGPRRPASRAERVEGRLEITAAPTYRALRPRRPTLDGGSSDPGGRDFRPGA